MNTLLEGPCEKMPSYTDMVEVFAAISQRQREFNWLLTECEGWPKHAKAKVQPFAEIDAQWFSGEQLTSQVNQSETQFLWAVFSGFPLHVAIDTENLATRPFADGNRDFWSDAPQIQHPLAEIEIVCWDSSATILLSRDPTIGISFRKYFPEAVDLDEYNRRRLSQD